MKKYLILTATIALLSACTTQANNDKQESSTVVESSQSTVAESSQSSAQSSESVSVSEKKAQHEAVSKELYHSAVNDYIVLLKETSSDQALTNEEITQLIEKLTEHTNKTIKQMERLNKDAWEADSFGDVGNLLILISESYIATGEGDHETAKRLSGEIGAHIVSIGDTFFNGEYPAEYVKLKEGQ